MGKETFYFSHDYNARTDIKIKKLLQIHGAVGYGIFWMLVEDLYNNANAMRLDYAGLAYDLRLDADLIKSVIHDFDLFQYDNGCFGSTSVQERLEERNKKSKRAAKSAFARWDKQKKETQQKEESQEADKQIDNANALQTESERNAIYKGKDIKEIKESNYVEDKSSTGQLIIDFKKLYQEVEKSPSGISNFIKTYNPDIDQPYMDLWNQFATKYSYSKIVKITKSRSAKLQKRLREVEFDFIEVLKQASISKGLVKAAWFSFDFIIENDTNYMKVIEGKYMLSFEKSENNNAGKKPAKLGARSESLSDNQLQKIALG